MLLFFTIFPQGKFTLMLDPAGDSQNTGRLIEDCLERGITLQFVQRLKQELEQKIDNLRVTLSRSPGEKVARLQNANFANRLDVDCYLSIHFYKETEVKPRVYIFTFGYNDDFITKKPDLYFYPYDKAHLINKDITKQWAHNIQDIFLLEENKKRFEFCGLRSLPFKPLIGVKAPAIGIEVGLCAKHDWQNCIDIFFDIISEIITHKNI